MKVILIYLLIINAAGFLVMTIDKLYAKKNMWRIPERTLLGVAAIGGSIGVWLGMYTVRHKTKHLKFVIGVPAILAVQIGLVLYFLLR
ncbi:MAG: DUF1294 domain-containing protein [Oscillospiraceae bacterium]|nr:DUF1294 domain-containing protein [Oscillospiraceae bacterium]MBQ7130354.1 DUF1294 domain-containing protein [Oscillospiraceae bacterium]